VPDRRYPNILLQSFITGQLAAELLRRELDAAGMTPNQFGVQSVIGAFGPVTPTDLAARLGMAAPTVSAWIKRLSEDGQVERKPHPTDGRSYLLEVTPAGRAALDEAVPHFGAALRKIEAALGDDLDVAWEGGRRFEEALRAALADRSDLK
jgi:DNA-binding MarR family transcriptional regulator